MSNKPYQIRNVSLRELNIAIDWAGAESWNPGLYDTKAFYATDPQGFLMGFIDDKPISSISAVSYNKDFGFLGFYIVKPEFRGNGYGLKIWNQAIEYLNTQNIGLDGVVSQQENYKKSGFKLYYRNVRFQGKTIKHTKTDNNVIKLQKIPFEELLNYDNNLFPAPRPQFLKKWITLPESFAFGFQKDGKLKGYTIVRKCRIGYKIGPLFVDNFDIAEKLFLAINNSLTPDTTIFLDTPEVNLEAIKLAKKYLMIKCFETARMYNKKQPEINMCKIFGVTTFELG